MSAPNKQYDPVEVAVLAPEAVEVRRSFDGASLGPSAADSEVPQRRRFG